MKSELYKILHNKIIVILSVIFFTCISCFSILFIKLSAKNAGITASLNVLIALSIIGYILFSALIQTLCFKEEVNANNFQNIVLCGKRKTLYLYKLISYIILLSVINLFSSFLMLILKIVCFKEFCLFLFGIEITIFFAINLHSIVLIFFNETYLFVYAGIQLLIIIFASNMNVSRGWLFSPTTYGYMLYRTCISEIQVVLLILAYIALAFINFNIIKFVKK